MKMRGMCTTEYISLTAQLKNGQVAKRKHFYVHHLASRITNLAIFIPLTLRASAGMSVENGIARDTHPIQGAGNAANNR